MKMSGLVAQPRATRLFASAGIAALAIGISTPALAQDQGGDAGEEEAEEGREVYAACLAQGKPE